MTTEQHEEREREMMSDIVLIHDGCENMVSSDEEEGESFVFRRRGQSEEEPLQLLELKPTHSADDDHTDETCDETSRASSHEEPLQGTQSPQDNKEQTSHNWIHDLMWLAICFFGIMASFVTYGILLEYTTSGGRRLHERTCTASCPWKTTSYRCQSHPRVFWLTFLCVSFSPFACHAQSPFCL